MIKWNVEFYGRICFVYSFRASQNGCIELIEYFISIGADCRANNTTKYSPLYAAIRGGFLPIVEKLLRQFPSAIDVRSTDWSRFNYFIFITFVFPLKIITAENWSPLHAACINGRNEIVQLLLTFPFAKECLKKYR